MKLLTCVLTENDCYKAKRTITPKGVMVHSTGANNPNLRRYVQPAASTPGKAELLAQLGKNTNGNDWNRPGTNACVHGFVGKLADGSVAAVQTLPWNHRGWHAGTGTSGKSANDSHISFEMCEDGLTDPVYFAQAYRTAAELTAMLCTKYGLNPMADGVVICHQDGYRRGIASNHGDVYNWFPRFGYDMNDFRAEVVRIMNGKSEEDDDMT
ncbi:MAG: peptidoglycan recognition protein family protein, partial [Oscillospiraceae bacterium]|nr:peptidoglycan recognition protein family protein [Oscillospiraceae bacterium]